MLTIVNTAINITVKLIVSRTNGDLHSSNTIHTYFCHCLFFLGDSMHLYSDLKCTQPQLGMSMKSRFNGKHQQNKEYKKKHTTNDSLESYIGQKILNASCCSKHWIDTNSYSLFYYFQNTQALFFRHRISSIARQWNRFESLLLPLQMAWMCEYFEYTKAGTARSWQRNSSPDDAHM